LKERGIKGVRMKRRGKYPAIVLIVTTMIFGIVGSMLCLSCKPSPTTPPSSPTKLFPAYTIDIKYPAEEGFVTVERGGAFTLPVTVRSLVDEPIKIRLALTTNDGVPEFVECELQKEYTTLNPGKTIDTQITIKIAEDAPPGSFYLGITGELQEPVKERGGEAMFFMLTVTDG